MYVYIYMYVCMHVCMYVYMYVCNIYIYIYIYIYTEAMIYAQEKCPLHSAQQHFLLVEGKVPSTTAKK